MNRVANLEDAVGKPRTLVRGFAASRPAGANDGLRTSVLAQSPAAPPALVRGVRTSVTVKSLTAGDGYLDAFRFGMPPHGGFAIGLGRWVARLVGATTRFPRDLTHPTS